MLLKKWADWFQFNTFGDPQLEMMVNAAATFVMDIKENKEPRWLTFTGSSGAGKTYLARKVYQWAKSQFQTSIVDDQIIYPYDWIYWPKEAAELQRREESEIVQMAGDTRLVAIDEIGGIRDATGYVSNRLTVILGQRDQKWTVMTSNLTVEQIADRIDIRIASRLIRDKNVAIEVDVIDYARRPKK